MAKSVLIGTLGGSWAIIPELLGFTNFDQIKLFSLRQDIAEISKKLVQIDELWLVTTDSDLTRESITRLKRWLQIIGENAPVIRVWAPCGIDDLATQTAAMKMRELTWRISLMAVEEFGAGNVCYCLAGGRKTMSSDLQQAATLFGGRQLLHLIFTDKLPEHINKAEPETFASSLPANEAALFLPVIIDSNLPTADLLAFRGEHDGQTINSIRFPVSLAPDTCDLLRIEITDELCRTIEERRLRAKNLLFNFARELSGGVTGTSFQALNVLPPSVINDLRSKVIGLNRESETEDLRWLRQLPKADLHCHLGGVSSAADLIKIAAAMHSECDHYQEILTPFLKDFYKFIDSRDLSGGRQFLLRSGESRFKESFNRIAKDLKVPVWAVSASIINCFKGDADLLDKFIFLALLEETKYIEIGISEYEALGDLQGSSLLQTETAIRTTCKLLVEKCKAENVSYIEVRCSPVNYTRGGLPAEEVVRFIREELDKGQPDLYASLIFIGSRHGKMSDFWRHVELAQDLLKDNLSNLFVPLVGFDLAGDEEFDSENFVPAFRPLFEQCLHITVHAGETKSADSIWKAVYTLNAERIGHGLKLLDREELLNHFLDRRISVEMCPSSNFQIVGFNDNYFPASKPYSVYPLKTYLEKGLKVFVNTDNPGISRTDATNELLRAARLTPGGLNRMEILSLVRNAFQASFAPYDLRRKVLLEAEKRVLEIIQDQGAANNG